MGFLIGLIVTVVGFILALAVHPTHPGIGQRQYRRLDHGRRRAHRLLRRSGVLVVVGSPLAPPDVRRTEAWLRAGLRRLLLALGLRARTAPRDRGGRGRSTGAWLLSASAGSRRYGEVWTSGGAELDVRVCVSARRRPT